MGPAEPAALSPLTAAQRFIEQRTAVRLPSSFTFWICSSQLQVYPPPLRLSVLPATLIIWSLPVNVHALYVRHSCR
jgi:hypothetical protein